MIEALIFDLDGLLVDSEPLQSRSYGIVLEEYGKTPILKKSGIVHTVGKNGEANWEILMQEHDLVEKMEVLRQKKRAAYHQILPQVKLMPGVKKLFNHLRGRNYKIGLATSSSFDTVTMILEKFSFDIFNAITAGNECKRAKPYPDIYLKIAEKLGVKPWESVAFEDSETGIEAAKRAGMKAYAIPSKYTKHQNFSKADKILHNLSQVIASDF